MLQLRNEKRMTTAVCMIKAQTLPAPPQLEYSSNEHGKTFRPTERCTNHRPQQTYRSHSLILRFSLFTSSPSSSPPPPAADGDVMRKPPLPGSRKRSRLDSACFNAPLSPQLDRHARLGEGTAAASLRADPATQPRARGAEGETKSSAPAELV